MGDASEIRFENRMSDADSLMWLIERDPMLRSTITLVTMLEHAPDRAQLQWRVDRATRRILRLRQRVVANPLSIAPPRWELDPNFNLSYHLRYISANNEGGLREVLDFAQPVAMQGFDRARPLWEFTVIDGLENGAAAMVMKVHHAITDGVGGIEMMLETFSLDDTVEEQHELPPEPYVYVLNQYERVRDAVAHETRRGLGIAKRTLRSLQSPDLDPERAAKRAGETAASASRLLRPTARPMSDLMDQRSLSVHFETLSLPLDDLKKAAASAGAKMNAAFLGGVTRGLAAYHDHHGHPVDELRMGLPISNRGDDNADVAGNQFTPARREVPVRVADPREHMARLDRLVRSLRDEPANALVDPMAGVLRRMPKTLVSNLFHTMLRGVDFTASNVPGVPVPLYLEGAPVVAQYALGPLSGAGMNVTLLSYVDRVNIGVNIDPAAIPDADVLMGCLRDAYDEILSVA
ncbi:MAG: WS/DGAT domain-containing protein [Acidimicrobiia bacterium]|nr:WS/DGAT domain-containing protein [Acidimicrobiia bacterium]